MENISLNGICVESHGLSAWQLSKHGIFEFLGHLHAGKESVLQIDFATTVTTQKEISKQIIHETFCRQYYKVHMN